MTKEFASMCGDAFDNKKTSSCHKMCKEENPESYAACLEDFKALSGHKTKKKTAGIVAPSKAEKKAVKDHSGQSDTIPGDSEKAEKPKAEKLKKENAEPKPKKEFDWFGDGVGTSASIINHMMINGATLEEMKKGAGCNRNRISGHFTGLRSGKRDRRPMRFEIFRAKETGKYHLDHPDADFETLTA